MDKAIRDFPKQFLFDPHVERNERLEKKPAVVVSGMGGSHLAADLLQNVYSHERIIVHADYGLPPMRDEDFQKCLFIANSYSGNTEEVIDGLERALEKKMASAVISVGGRLEELADMHGLPHVKIPDTGIQPRSALGFSLIGLMKLMGLGDVFGGVRSLADTLSKGDMEQQGKELADALREKTPVIYASGRNMPIAYNWKIKMNETGKTPAFYNVFPELNHNEMTGFDAVRSTRALSAKFHFLFLTDLEDDPRIQKRMDVCRDLYIQRDLPVTEIPLKGNMRWERIFRSLLVADWFSYHTGMAYGVETEQVPMVEEFKKVLRTMY